MLAKTGCQIVCGAAKIAGMQTGLFFDWVGIGTVQFVHFVAKGMRATYRVFFAAKILLMDSFFALREDFCQQCN
jgi:hypothetical protein